MGVGVGVALVSCATIAVAEAVIDGLLSDWTLTVTVPVPAADRSVLRTMAPVDRPGRMKVGIDWVGRPSSPVRLAVTGPLVPVIGAV